MRGMTPVLAGVRGANGGLPRTTRETTWRRRSIDAARGGSCTSLPGLRRCRGGRAHYLWKRQDGLIDLSVVFSAAVSLKYEPAIDPCVRLFHCS